VAAKDLEAALKSDDKSAIEAKLKSCRSASAIDGGCRQGAQATGAVAAVLSKVRPNPRTKASSMPSSRK
jgi:hypothetical protein